jgi:hypothetical protein
MDTNFMKTEKFGIIHKSFISYLISTYMKIETALLMIGIIAAIAAGVIITVISSAATPVFAQAQKFLICHHDREIEVPLHTISTHLSHGDFLGPCVT